MKVWTFGQHAVAYMDWKREMTCVHLEGLLHFSSTSFTTSDFILVHGFQITSSIVAAFKACLMTGPTIHTRVIYTEKAASLSRSAEGLCFVLESPLARLPPGMLLGIFGKEREST